MKSTFIYDTTLRDGTQGENISFSVKEKIEITKELDHMGFHYIEGGWPSSNPKDRDFFRNIGKESLHSSKIAAFGSTRKPHTSKLKDACLKSLLMAETPVVTIFGKSWPLHVELISQNTLDENLFMIEESISLLKSHNREVIYDAEHFFDGFKENYIYAIKTLKAAREGGADYIVLCDTNGGTLPFELESIFDTVINEFVSYEKTSSPLGFGIHAHNDCGLAVANSITAVQKGASMIQGTVNGYGERCGNADLITIIPILWSKMGTSSIPEENMAHLKKLSNFISETANMIPLNTQPFVGKSAFAHKGGIHVNAVMKNPRAYEHIVPSMIGNRRRVLVSDLAGKSNVEYKVKELNLPINRQELQYSDIIGTIKYLENNGYQFDIADASLKILIEKLTGNFQSLFELQSFRVSIEKNKEDSSLCHTTMKISVEDRTEITAAEGNGPVHALDNALRKALSNFYPEIEEMQLVDYKVRVIDGEKGTSSKVRVFIESRDSEEIWGTIGVSEDIIEASWMALFDSFQYKLSKEFLLKEKKNKISTG